MKRNNGMYLAICSDVEHRNDGILNLSVLLGQAIEDNLQDTL